MTVDRFGGRLQTRIMEVLWDRRRAVAREITDAVNEALRADGEPEVSHSTVQTLLRKLESKGAVRHERDGRTFVFLPMARPEGVKRHAARDLIDRLFGGSAAGLVSWLLKNEEVPPEEIARLRALLAEQEATADPEKEAEA
ncbi:MAG: BlaI/MecI/CopY family transcriptional regulator [Sumerlaeia bacterium]